MIPTTLIINPPDAEINGSIYSNSSTPSDVLAAGKDIAHKIVRAISGSFLWVTSQAQSLYTSQNRTSPLTPRTSPLAPLIETSPSFTSPPTPRIETFPSFIVKDSPDLLSKTCFPISESRQEERESQRMETLQIDNKETLQIDNKETTVSKESSVSSEIPDTSDTNKYVTVADFNKYLGQFRLNLPPLIQSKSCELVDRKELVRYLELNVPMIPSHITAEFLKGKKYITRNELRDLSVKISLYFCRFDQSTNEKVHSGFVLEDYRSEAVDRQEIRKKKYAEIGRLPSKTFQTIATKDSVKKAMRQTDQSKTQTRSHHAEQDCDAEKGPSDKARLSRAIQKEDGYNTRFAKIGLANCDSDGIIDESAIKKLGLRGFRISRAETYLDLDKEQSLLPNAPGAGQTSKWETNLE